MNFIGLIPVFIGVIYLIYSVLCKNKLNYYSRRSKIKVVKSYEFLALQFNFAIINTIYLIAYGFLIIVFNLDSIFVILGLAGFYTINFLLLLQSKKRGYIEYK
ncbi:hypothetical protein CSC2_14160 [Clostridium zeae]|uniref:DUF3784 domain-containing protein n=1 Tax=Clostridium zeae TaxID=2759022 RepID=A0ABQ1E7X4_9CLOT|nr:hypothetical protein [Clostridium zeae]GFZ30890.1 hypothetical protein CSC2_14160 [Clostridium zeae]